MDPALLLLVPTRSYRTEDFLAAARKLGVPVVVGSDLCHSVEERFGARPDEVSLDFRRPGRAAERVAALAVERPIAGVVPTDEGTAILAALAAERLGLRHNPPEATRRAGNKHLQRETLRAAGLPVPPFALHPLAGGPERAAAAVAYPCVLKPLVLSASRGVIRADDPAAFVAAWRRIEKILHGARAERRPQDAEAARFLLVEGFVPGAEVALEGLLRGGRLEVLALFDKPDPLDGPFFEETLYVTPSRHPAPLQAEVARLVEASARALGLSEGPLHAELRLSPAGPVVLEVAARSIGGLCARTLRFGAGVSLEEVLVAHAMGLPLPALDRERRAAGVMMLPIPHRGVLRGVGGIEEARAVPGVEDVVITIPEGREVEPLPEGDAYLGFAFARGERPEEVEAALRAAHARLRIDIREALPLV
ncbi:ATP-grasp domain-containing protein [Anaeromyxobacter diazotrophicus]|uniref:Phosphoribosylglycinamide synthetase n=1 Tax=Anaeromyxobacter diazotrophicus TaxID=2590199 RepID=A0A7I9VJ07_9BACT|nr:ATP-grasp domain-containing protein [Anaeromyxobacter diazotrophicus]GEJ56394.1 phosphoribosylglycinamide synthetase [Anaeromyxobacter diazotrophicus]